MACGALVFALFEAGMGLILCPSLSNAVLQHVVGLYSCSQCPSGRRVSDIHTFSVYIVTQHWHTSHANTVTLLNSGIHPMQTPNTTHANKDTIHPDCTPATPALW
jgi:hypothetical protein